MQQRPTRHLKQHEMLYNAITSESLPKRKKACSTSELSPTVCSHVALEFNTRPGGPRADRGREREREEKTIARLTGEKTVRHDRVAVAAFLSSRRSSVNVVIVAAQHVSLVIVAVVVVFVVVRLGSWPILCLVLAHLHFSSTSWRDGPKCNESENFPSLIHQLARRPQVQ